MSPLTWLVLAAVAFLGSHLLLSHPLRAPLVARLGERRFTGVYVAVALATFGAMIVAARSVGPEAPLWAPGQPLWIAATVLMWFGSILFIGSFQGNPAFPRPGEPARAIAAPSGVFAITRHAMMWGFAIWGVVHIAVVATPSAIVIALTIIILALAGSAGQDAKKQRLVGPAWDEWLGRTSFVPFGRGLAWPGIFAVVGGTLLFLLATWLHTVVGRMPAGIWLWLG